MSSQLVRSGECRKFSPNIFNKTKCTNCFRQKEEHSAEALESNRATRKVVKCGYLFVAPGWDFTNPINRTKRWQRRWFVLYDDGELSYSLDEHPETVPQACIDMNSVLEVAGAEEITGNAFSLAITAQDNVHFVKGTSREEARFWTDVLSVFPRSKGRHKRNATFPGTQSSTKSSHILQSPIRNSNNTSEAVRNQYNSRISVPVWEGDDVFPTRDTNTKSSPTEPLSPNNRKVYMGSPPTRDKVDDKARSRRVANREKRGLKTGRSFSEDISKMVPNWPDKPPHVGLPEVSRRLLMEEYESECKLKDIADSLTQPRSRLSPPNQLNIEPTRENDTATQKQVRGDPDGCGLDVSVMRYSPSDLRVDLPAEELLNIKKGWLMKQGQEKEWTKHWFVLRGNALLYYRDPTAEDQGILDGVIDLSGVAGVSEVQVQRNYGFQTTRWDDKHYVLSAMTGRIRANWMSAIRKAAGLPESNSNLSSPVQEQDDIVSSTPLTPRSLLFSSDDEYRTASEGGRRESGEWGEALPPSPPLNRTPMSKVKERARGVSRWGRVYGSKRSRSSPPTSRRSTLDSVSSQEIVMACCNQQKINDDSQEEIIRRKQCQITDITALEKQIEELQKRAEESGKQRARESAELETLKKRYIDEKCKWEQAVRSVECELEDASTRCATLCTELNAERDMVLTLRGQLKTLEARLASGIEENEALYRRIQGLEKPTMSVRDRARSVDSLSDLTNIDLDLDFSQLEKERIVEEYQDLRVRFEKAVSEIRAMKRELRESQAQTDCLELSVVRARQEAKLKSEEAEANSRLMAARIQDLAAKLSAAEKQIRTLKQKLSKTETREKRRSLSLKGQESFTICKEVEEKLNELENKVSALNLPKESGVAYSKDKKLDKMSSRLRRKSLDSITSSEPMKVLLRLSSLEAKVAKANVSPAESKNTELKLFNGEQSEVDSTHKIEMINEVKKMENLLRTKLVVLAKKKESLIKAGQWTNEARLNLLAEKLAYESVLIGRLHDAVLESKNLDLTDAERLINGLDSKLSGGKPNIETSLDYLVKSLAKHLTQQAVKRVNRKVKERKKQDPAVTELLNKKNSLDTKVGNYINQAVNNLAQVFAAETLAEDSGVEKSKDHIQAAWSLAQEFVNQELIQAEISQVLSQCSQSYQNYIENESQTRFVGIVKDRANLELWVATADDNLKLNMTSAIKMLQDEYSKCLEKLKSEQCVPVKPTQQDEEKARESLQRFVDVVAHKSLLDARISVLCNGEYCDNDQEQGTFEENSLLSEIQFLYVKFCRELVQESKDEERLKDAVDRVSNELTSLERILQPGDTKLSNEKKLETLSDSWLEALCRKCEHLKDKILKLQKVAGNWKDCKRCMALQQEITRLEEVHSLKIKELEQKKDEEIVKIRAEYDDQRVALIKKYKDEEDKLIERNKKLERRLGTLDSEYSQQMENLRAAYHKTVNASGGESEETLRHRYQTEIQHLRAVCEKGLVAMENSHRRRIAELQEKHEQELETLRSEKEQALAEETHATLAALDAMRKAHEAEVQKEITKFKAEFLNKMQSNHDINAIHREHQAEMEEIKQEILSLSEKYSIKCVESASLEDKLRKANQQLAHAHQHIVQLDSRNKQLRAHLVAEANSDVIPRLHEHTHAVGVAVDNHPMVVHATPRCMSVGCQTHAKSSVKKKSQEPPPQPSAEVIRCPDSFSLLGMVSKRKEMFERRFTAPATCSRTSRVSLT